MYHLPLDTIKLRTRRVNEQAFKDATHGRKVSLRSTTARFPLRQTPSYQNIQSLNTSNIKPTLCTNCRLLHEQIRLLKEENQRLKETIDRNKEDSGKLDTLYVQIARAKERMAQKMLSKQEQLMNILNFSRILPDRQTDAMSTVRQLNQLTRMTSHKDLKQAESTGV